MRRLRAGLRIWALVLVLAVPAGASAQEPARGASGDSSVSVDTGLAQAAERVRAAWARHDATGIIASAPKVLVQLPGAEPAAALGPAQAAALLGDYIAPAEEVALHLATAREVAPDRGYVELERRFRVQGTQEVRTQSLLLGWRRAPAGWQLAELRIVE